MRWILIAALALTACGDSPTEPRNTAAGDYELVTFNGEPLPALYFQNSAGRIEAINGFATLRTDGSYTQRLTMRTTFNAGGTQTTPIVENGSYTQNGQSVQFTIPASGGNPAFSYEGTVSGNTLSYTYDGIAYVYRK